MTQPLGMDDFFSLEAGEYLERLTRLISGEEPPNADELVRFTRALRGSALMAGQQPIARATGGLEHIVRAFREGRRGWDGDIGEICTEAIASLRVLVERVRVWSAEDTAHAEQLAVRLEASAGGTPRPPTPRGTGAEAGVRAFLAREAAGVGSALDQASKALAAFPPVLDASQAVLRRMQPLRGLAALSDFPPLAEMLEGIESTISGLSREEVGVEQVAARFEAAAAALTRAARDVAERGRPDPDAPEFKRFADLLIEADQDEAEIVPIESLYYDGTEGMVQRGTPPRGTSTVTLTPMSIVSRAERLGQVADEIVQATSATQRELRLHTLMADLRGLSSGLPPVLEDAVERFAQSARGAVARGAATRDPARFADQIREAGARLATASDVVDPAHLAQAFDALAQQLALSGGPAPARPATIPAAHTENEELPIVPIESLLLDEEAAVVPIEALEAAPQAAPAGAVVAVEGTDLAASWSAFEMLLGRAPAAPVAEAAPAAVPPPDEGPVLDIDQLLYRGPAALDRARQVGRQLREVRSGGRGSQEVIDALLDELLDLMALAET